MEQKNSHYIVLYDSDTAVSLLKTGTAFTHFHMMDPIETLVKSPPMSMVTYTGLSD